MKQAFLPVQIQYARESDYQQWQVLWEAYQHFYKVELGDDVTEKTWSRFFNNVHPVFCLMARDGDKILGFAHFVFHESTWSTTQYCYLEDLYVVNEVRGRQVGKQLIDYLSNIAKTQNCTRLYWHTHETNKVAQKLYNWIGHNPGTILYEIPLQ